MRTWVLVCAVAALVQGAGTSSAVVLADDDVVGAWLFDDSSYATVDSSDAGNDGEATGNVTWIDDGRFGGALLFEGDESSISVEDDPSLHFTEGTDFTAAVWLRTDMVGFWPPMILAKNYYPTEERPWWALYYANGSKSLDGSASFFLRDDEGSNHHIGGGPLVNDGAWHHLVGTRQGETIRFYVDSVEVGSKDNAGFDVGTAPSPLHMMSHLERWQLGSLDEVLLLRRALDKGDVRELMDVGIEAFFSVSSAVGSKGKLAVQWEMLKN